MSMAAVIKPLNKRRSWKALAAHYKKARELHLRELFADDPRRGQRMSVGAVGSSRLLEEPGDRRNSQAAPATGGRIRPEGTDRRHVPGGENQHH